MALKWNIKQAAARFSKRLSPGEAQILKLFVAEGGQCAALPGERHQVKKRDAPGYGPGAGCICLC